MGRFSRPRAVDQDIDLTGGRECIPGNPIHLVGMIEPAENDPRLPAGIANVARHCGGVLHTAAVYDDFDLLGAQHASDTRADTAARACDECALASQA
jgi:hypothetical protein